MKQWDIKVLYLGKITANLSFVWPAGMPPLEKDFPMSAPYLGFLLQADGQNILVDTGISEKFIVNGKAWGALPAEGGSPFLKEALEKEGIDPAEIQRVVYTHLHNDHAANCQLFSNASIIFQKDEWWNLLEPLPVQNLRMDYDPELINELKAANTLRVNGDFELEEGVRLLKTPGHTAGSQSVAVNTRKGVVVLVGDLCLFDFMMFPGLTEIVDMEGNAHAIPPAPSVFGPAVPHLLTYNYYDFYDSIYKVKAMASRSEPGFIISGHEPSLVVTGI
jgi:N-acyl homoserine lactone hydrolase